MTQLASTTYCLLVAFGCVSGMIWAQRHRTRHMAPATVLLVAQRSCKVKRNARCNAVGAASSCMHAGGADRNAARTRPNAYPKR